MKVAQPRFNPTRLFVEKDRLAWFWFLFAMGVLLLAAVDRILLVQSFNRGERVVVVDPANTYCRTRQCRRKRPGQFWTQAGLRHLDALEEARDNGHWDKLWLTT
jgi:hypothetical protein